MRNDVTFDLWHPVWLDRGMLISTTTQFELYAFKINDLHVIMLDAYGENLDDCYFEMWKIRKLCRCEIYFRFLTEKYVMWSLKWLLLEIIDAWVIKKWILPIMEILHVVYLRDYSEKQVFGGSLRNYATLVTLNACIVFHSYNRVYINAM